MNDHMPYDTSVGANPAAYPQPFPVSIPRPPRVYDSVDRVFAIAALLLGYLAFKVFVRISGGLGLMTTVMFLGITLFILVYSIKSGFRFTVEKIISFILTFMLSLVFVVTDNSAVKLIAFFLTAVSECYVAYSMLKTNNNSVILNVLEAVLISPFAEYGSVFGAIFHKAPVSEEKKTKKKELSQTVKGIILGIPVMIAAAFLLLGSDSNFVIIFNNLSTAVENLVFEIFLFVISLPVGMYIYSALYSRIYRKNNPSVVHEAMQINRPFSASLCNGFLMPASLLYAFYIFVQIYYCAVNFGITDGGFDYSEYARSGFFELCMVVVMNLGLAALVMFLVKLEKGKPTVSVRRFLIAFSVLTILLVCTALIKMFMYIDFYGMTPLRVYTTVFMIYLFLVFLVLIVKQFNYKISLTKIAYFMAVFVIVMMSVIPVDGLIFKSNIERYNNGEIDWIGYNSIEQLDCSAVKYMYPYVGEIDDVSKFFYHNFSYNDTRFAEYDKYNFNLSRYFAYRYGQEYAN